MSPYGIYYVVSNQPLNYILLFICSEDGNVKLLTKGDNNSVDDRGLYAPGQLWIRRNEVVGRARGCVYNS